RDRDDHLPASAFGAPGDHAHPEGDWSAGLGPSAAAAFIARRLEAGAKELTVVRMGPLLPGGAERLTLTGIEACTERFGDREVDGFCADWGEHGRVMLDARGYPLIARFADGSRTVVFRATSREEALAPYEPVESVADVLVPVTPEDWDGRDAAFVVERLDGEAWDLPHELGRFTLRAQGEHLRSTHRPAPPERLGETERDAALRETDLINFSKLPPVAWANDVFETPGEARLRFAHRRVHDRLLHRGFALGLADAETAYMRREGDCTEHAVLLAALLRREGVPTRVVGGLVPIEHEGRIVMAQHLWVQAYLERDDAGVWTDLDATLAPGAPLTPRVPLGATGVTDETVADLVRRMGALAGLVRVEAIAPE
ncbi:MAG: transglutaminase family protein, partial [Phycisphaerales bacterium JB059]